MVGGREEMWSMAPGYQATVNGWAASAAWWLYAVLYTMVLGAGISNVQAQTTHGAAAQPLAKLPVAQQAVNPDQLKKAQAAVEQCVAPVQSPAATEEQQKQIDEAMTLLKGNDRVKAATAREVLLSVGAPGLGALRCALQSAKAAPAEETKQESTTRRQFCSRLMETIEAIEDQYRKPQLDVLKELGPVGLRAWDMKLAELDVVSTSLSKKIADARANQDTEAEAAMQAEESKSSAQLSALYRLKRALSQSAPASATHSPK